jgi:hypothetical protein
MACFHVAMYFCLKIPADEAQIILTLCVCVCLSLFLRGRCTSCLATRHPWPDAAWLETRSRSDIAKSCHWMPLLCCSCRAATRLFASGSSPGNKCLNWGKKVSDIVGNPNALGHRQETPTKETRHLPVRCNAMEHRKFLCGA